MPNRRAIILKTTMQIENDYANSTYKLILKGGELSSQFQWFTTAKIKLLFLIFFILILGVRLQRYLTNTKRYPPKKVFGNSEFCSSRQNHSRPDSLENCRFGEKNKTHEFPKAFFGGYLFVFVEYFCNPSPKTKTKNIKNYSPPLTHQTPIE